MLKRLTTYELEGLRDYLYKDMGDINLINDIYQPIFNEEEVEDAVNEGYRETDIRKNLIAINHIRYNVYFDKHGRREAIPIALPNAYRRVYKDNHLFFRSGLKDGCHCCLKSSCGFFGICCESQHYSRHTVNRHPGYKAPGKYANATPTPF